MNEVRPLRGADEQRVVAAANGGDADAFAELYHRHRDWVASVAFRITGNTQDALDVLQEVFSYLWGKFPGFHLRGTLRSFLYPVVKHHSIDLIRRRRKLVEIDTIRDLRDESPAWHGPGPDFEALIRGLPAAQREVVRLRFGLDFSLEEIAQALLIPVGTVKSRLHNALKALRNRPDGRESGDR